MKKWAIRILGGLGAVLAVILLLAVDFVRSFTYSVPEYDATLRVPGLAEPVRILRDRYAIPHIVAETYEDAAYALGYVHAQDRLWQMELARRFVQGRLSELFGETAFSADATMRTMGLYRAAEDSVEHLSRESQRKLAAYADGVNAYISGHKGRWPIEFVLAGDTPPEFWRPADSIAVLKGMAFQLSENMFSESARARLTPVLGARSVQDFFPPFSDAALPAYLSEIYGATRTGAISGVPDTTASDNWAVDGAHSVTGKPLLANDPHLGFTIPSVWYLAHLAMPEEDIVGGTLAGVPAIIVGHNRHVAWGVTNTGPDTEDLYLERIDADDPSRYQTPSGFAQFDTHTDTIKIRFGGERRIQVRTTRHGPVMPDAGGSPFVAPSGYVLALAWTALEPDDTTMDGLFAIAGANNAAEFKQGAHSIVAPMQNILYADDSGESGHIGLILPGRVPIRSASNDSLGLVPAPGWDGKYDWQGFIPQDQMVDIGDPASGHLATANNKTVPDDYPYTLSREWEPNYRLDRINALLDKTPKHSLATFSAMQRDTLDNFALLLKPRLTAAGPFEADDAAAADLVAQWDGGMLAFRPEPLIWAAWTRALAKRIYGDELGRNFASFWGYRPEFTLRVLDNTDGAGRWCDDRGTPEIEDCTMQIRLALHDAVAELTAAYGADPHRWRWGAAHKAVHAAQPLGSFPVIGPYFNREVEMDGGPFTLLRGDNRMSSDRPYAAIHGSGFRGIYDLSEPDRSLFIISTGQSGNVYSPHYDDLLQLWAKGEYVLIPTSSDLVSKIAVNRTILEPAHETLSTTP
jgi:penicillin amidase